MILKIKNTKDRGLQSERVVLQAVESGEIGSYFLFKAKQVTTDGISPKIENPFWFPDKNVDKGDLVVLYTKSGQSGYKTNKDGSNTYFFYRNLENPIFKEDDIALLVLSETWEAEDKDHRIEEKNLDQSL